MQGLKGPHAKVMMQCQNRFYVPSDDLVEQSIMNF